MTDDKKLNESQDEKLSTSEKAGAAGDFSDDDPSVEWARFAAQACAIRQKLNEKNKQ